MERTDTELLAATVAGDEDAYAAFFRRHERAVTRFAARRCPEPDAVADAVAETFLAALRAAPRYRADHADATPWLLGIAVRVVLRQERTARRWWRLHARAADSGPRYLGAEADAVAAAIDAQRRRPALEEALAALPERERIVLELIAHADLSPSEVAVALGISPNAARIRLSRARARMKASLGDLEPDLEALHAR